MRSLITTSSASLLLLLLSTSATAITLDCARSIRLNGTTFDLSPLSGPKSVHDLRRRGDFLINTTYTIDICTPLPKPKNVDKTHACSFGTRVCGIEYDHEADGGWTFREVIEVAGEYTANKAKGLDPSFEALGAAAEGGEKDRQGVRVRLNGGKHDGVDQAAIVDFVCDEKLDGTEGFETEEAETEASEGFADARSFGGMMGREQQQQQRREEAEEGDGEGKGDLDIPDMDKGKSLQFVSYEFEEDVYQLKLEWRTKYACKDVKRGAGEDAKKAGWGFFTWFLIIAFLLVAAYIIFGSWLNYNRYGARGWDLVPHGDAIRDLPYIVKDLGEGMMSKLRGNGGSRGGYSAV